MLVEYNKKIKVNIIDKDDDYKTRQANYLSIYHNYTQYSIDKLQLRKPPKKTRPYFTKSSSKKCKALHIVLDKNDLSKSIKTMYMLCNNKNEVAIDYYLDIENGVVRKLKDVTRYYRKHNLTLDYNLIYHGTKSKATRKLENLLNN